MLYYYTLVKPEILLIGKFIFNTILSLIISITSFVVYAFILGNPVSNALYFGLTLVVSSIGFSGVLTLISGIVSKVNNSTALLAILSFPVLLPVLLLTVRLSKNAIDGIDAGSMNEKLLTLVSVDAVVMVTALLLFPFIWRS